MIYLANALALLIQFAFGCVVALFVFRLLAEAVRADFYNPICQFLYRATNPVLTPLRRAVPTWRRINIAALLIAWLLARFWQRGGRGAAGWRSFYPVVCAAIFVHILGDLITQFGTMILAPFSDQRFGWGTTFIIDLPFTGIILAGLLASALWRGSRGPATAALVLLAGWVGVQAMGRAEAIDAGSVRCAL